jgi:PPOX class probable F420-dependent enzyme
VDVADAQSRHRFSKARVARLATVRPDGGPHLVPVVFALVRDVIWTAVDAKPKSPRRLQRLRNIEAEPRVSLLVDHFDGDWSKLWWVRVDGTASIVPVDGAEGRAAVAALTVKYPQYESDPPPGPLIRIEPNVWRTWHA